MSKTPRPIRRQLGQPVAGFLVLALALLACSPETEAPDPPPAIQAEPSATEISRAADPRPSIVLIVVESLRTDAVAAYGRDASSPLPSGGPTATPNLDQLAEKGLRYAWAISASPETATSHASILTGLRADQHGVGLWGQTTAPESLELLAESLRAEGYATAGFVENPMAGPDYGFDQGFDHFAAPTSEQVVSHAIEGHGPAKDFRILDRIRRWHERRDRSKPYFLFVNLFDPHLPLDPDGASPFLPPDVSSTRIDNLTARQPLRNQICSKLPDPSSLEIIRALYRSEVAKADRKIGSIVALTRAAGEPPPITVVTADHGTHLGEGRLLGHHFNLDNRLLRVPLVIEGAPEARGVIESPVAQRRIADSILCWSGVAARCADQLPRAEFAEPLIGPDSDPIISILGDDRNPQPVVAVVDTGSIEGETDHARALCSPKGDFYGRSVSLIRDPMKLIWRQYAPPRLHDLSWDAAERSDQIERAAPVAAGMLGEVSDFISTQRLDQIRLDAPTGSLAERAKAAFDEGLASVLEEEEAEVDAIWFAQLAQRDHPQPALESWLEEQIQRKRDDPFYPIVAPKAPTPQLLRADPGRGLAKWMTYLLSSIAGPDDLAVRYLTDYLAMEETGYILTHQVSALEWARAANRPLPASTYDRLPSLLARIEAEHEQDPVFSDLWVERAAFMTLFGSPSPAQLESWVSTVVDNHLGAGSWGEGAAEIRFDGQADVATQRRQHPRGLAMVVLARYLGRLPGPSPTDG